MYNSMNGTGMGEAIYLDSQQPWMGTYTPSWEGDYKSNLPTSMQTTATPTAEAKALPGAGTGWLDKLLSSADKALDVFNPNIPAQGGVNYGSPTPANTGMSNGMKIGLIGLGLAAAVGIAYVATRPKKRK